MRREEPQLSGDCQQRLVFDMCEAARFERMSIAELVTHLSRASAACLLAHDRFVRVVVVRQCSSTCSALFMRWCSNSGIDIRYRRSLRDVLRSSVPLRVHHPGHFVMATGILWLQTPDDLVKVWVRDS